MPTTGVSASSKRDRAVLHLAGGVALGVDVGDLFEFERALERGRIVDVAAHEEATAHLTNLARDLADVVRGVEHDVDAGRQAAACSRRSRPSAADPPCRGRDARYSANSVIAVTCET